MAGYLHKQSSDIFRSWQRRYFEIGGHYLNYYKDQSKVELRGTFDLDSWFSISLEGRKLYLDIEDNPVQLRADTSQLAEKWNAALAVFVPDEGHIFNFNDDGELNEEEPDSPIDNTSENTSGLHSGFRQPPGRVTELISSRQAGGAKSTASTRNESGGGGRKGPFAAAKHRFSNARSSGQHELFNDYKMLKRVGSELEHKFSHLQQIADLCPVAMSSWSSTGELHYANKTAIDNMPIAAEGQGPDRKRGSDADGDVLGEAAAAAALHQLTIAAAAARGSATRDTTSSGAVPSIPTSGEAYTVQPVLLDEYTEYLKKDGQMSAHVSIPYHPVGNRRFSVGDEDDVMETANLVLSVPRSFARKVKMDISRSSARGSVRNGAPQLQQSKSHSGLPSDGAAALRRSAKPLLLRSKSSGAKNAQGLGAIAQRRGLDRNER
jgi:hypothetical protein